MMTAVFRVVGGARLGLGHLRRCWTLAERLQASGADVRFVATSHEARLATVGAGFEVVMEENESAIGATADALRACAVPRVLIVDDPDLNGSVWGILRGIAPVVCFDDYGERALPVDLVVNGSAGAEALAYRGVSDTRCLLGPRYIVLRDRFAAMNDRAISPDVRRVLVLGGGADSGGSTARLVRVVLETLTETIVDTVIGPFAPPLSLDAFAPAMRQRIQLHERPEDMATLMSRVDLAMSGGGQTTYELAATGTPTIGVRVAVEQSLNLRGLEAAGCLRDVGAPTESAFDARLAEALLALAAQPSARALMSRRGRGLVDGRGAERVAQHIGLLGRPRPLLDESDAAFGAATSRGRA